jgi:class 3 adenylate cyclase
MLRFLFVNKVNLASRMESTGVSGRIQVTPEIVDLVSEDDFAFERRGVSISHTPSSVFANMKSV